MNQREAFEKWCISVGYTGMQVIKLPGDVYVSGTVNALWQAWQAAQQAQWQPIETAPRDGTEILVGWNECSERLIVWWHNGWDTGNSRQYYEIIPDVWMPLPPEPKR